MSEPPSPRGPFPAAWPLPLGPLAERAGLARTHARWAESMGLATLGLAEVARRGSGSAATGFASQLGGIAFQRGDLHRAEKYFRAALGLARAADASEKAAAAHVNLGAVANVRGRFREALSCYRRGCAAYRRIGHVPGQARALHNMGMAFADLKRWRQAGICFRKARELAETAGDDDLIGLIALNETEVLLETGELEHARDLCDDACDRLTAAGARVAVADVNVRYGEIYRRMNRPVLAREHFSRAVDLGRELQAPLTEAEALRGLGLLHAAAGTPEPALECLGRSLKLFRSLQAGHELAQRVVVGIAELLSRELAAADPNLFGHSARVARYAVALACELDYAPDQMKGILVAGYLHDIGKLQIDPGILAKAAPLTPAERKIVQRHAALGAQYLERFDLPWDIVPLARWHHEAYDGTGYPDGLVGQAIPLGARILLVADVFDALTSHQPYRAAWSREEALTYLELGRGRLCDPDVVDAMLEVARRPAYTAAPSVETTADSLPVDVTAAFASLAR
ncbi:MAG: HD domain-containing phosphohydrolase [Gemmatimonadota bacterium]